MNSLELVIQVSLKHEMSWWSHYCKCSSVFFTDGIIKSVSDIYMKEPAIQNGVCELERWFWFILRKVNKLQKSEKLMPQSSICNFFYSWSTTIGLSEMSETLTNVGMIKRSHYFSFIQELQKELKKFEQTHSLNYIKVSFLHNHKIVTVRNSTASGDNILHHRQRSKLFCFKSFNKNRSIHIHTNLRLMPCPGPLPSSTQPESDKIKSHILTS